MPEPETTATVTTTTDSTGTPAFGFVQTPASPPAQKEDEPLGEAGMKALEEERAARREAEKALKEEREAAELAKKSAEEQAMARAEKAETRAKEAEMKALRLQVGAATGLPAALVEKLSGDTEEAMLEDAKKIKEAIDAARPPAGGFDGGARGSSGNPADMNALLRKAAGRG